ncbi:hypothetical protein G9A89_001850 [Geosiphon pyriformis]|nr:hypothetical protein G9A89_001850 [Geosiphon pyriformis]
MPTERLKIEAFEQNIIQTCESLSNIISAFVANYQNGLSKDETIMIPSYVTCLPTGNETGTFLAMDFGGTNLQVAVVRLLGNGNFEIKQNHFRIPEESKTVAVEVLFDWVSRCVKKSVEGVDIICDELKMGVTFSFPVQQIAIDKGIAMKMGKGFTVPGLVGNDVVQLLNSAFDRQNLKIKIVAIVNDTISTLVAQAYTDPKSVIAAVFATGTNAACIVPISSIKKTTFPRATSLNLEEDIMLINTEWGLIKNDFLPFTKYDLLLDEKSDKPKFQPYEKMIGGYYLGELVRLTLLDFAENLGLFGDVLPSAFMEKNSINTELISKIDGEANFAKIIELLNEKLSINPSITSHFDIQILKSIIRCYTIRASQLAAAGLASLLKLRYGDFSKIETDITIAIDGSIYHKYQQFSQGMKDTLKLILGEKISTLVKIVGVQDGGCLGAAIIAMMYSKKSERLG